MPARTHTVLCTSLTPPVLAERKQHPQLHVVLMAEFVWGSPRRFLPFQSHPKACQFLERHPVHRIGSRERSVPGFPMAFLAPPLVVDLQAPATVGREGRIWPGTVAVHFEPQHHSTTLTQDLISYQYLKLVSCAASGNEAVGHVHIDCAREQQESRISTPRTSPPDTLDICLKPHPWSLQLLISNPTQVIKPSTGILVWSVKRQML